LHPKHTTLNTSVQSKQEKVWIQEEDQKVYRQGQLRTILIEVKAKQKFLGYF